MIAKKIYTKYSLHPLNAFDVGNHMIVAGTDDGFIILFENDEENEIEWETVIADIHYYRGKFYIIDYRGNIAIADENSVFVDHWLSIDEQFAKVVSVADDEVVFCKRGCLFMDVKQKTKWFLKDVFVGEKPLKIGNNWVVPSFIVKLKESANEESFINILRHNKLVAQHKFDGIITALNNCDNLIAVSVKGKIIIFEMIGINLRKVQEISDVHTTNLVFLPSTCNILLFSSESTIYMASASGRKLRKVIELDEQIESMKIRGKDLYVMTRGAIHRYHLFVPSFF